MWRTPDPDRFVVGANLPWVGYGTDVGASAWYPEGGFARRSAALEVLDRTFATLAQDGVAVVRVFLLCDLRSGVHFDDDGIPAGLDASVIPDITALIEAARRHGVGLMPVLLDFHLCGPLEIVRGVQLGGRSRLIADEDASAALVERVIAPIVDTFGRDDTIVAWDVINEPEWCLREGFFSPPGAVKLPAMQRFLDRTVRYIHGVAAQPVTVGCAGTWKLDLVRPLPLDFHQIHWYDRFGWPALIRPVSDLELGPRPVILGEFSGRSARLPDVLDAAKAAGYEGAMVWSVLSEDEYSAYPSEIPAWIRSAAPPPDAI